MPQDVAEYFIDLLCDKPNVCLESVVCEQGSAEWEDCLCWLSIGGDLTGIFAA